MPDAQALANSGLRGLNHFVGELRAVFDAPDGENVEDIDERKTDGREFVFCARDIFIISGAYEQTVIEHSFDLHIEHSRARHVQLFVYLVEAHRFARAQDVDDATAPFVLNQIESKKKRIGGVNRDFSLICHRWD